MQENSLYFRQKDEAIAAAVERMVEVEKVNLSMACGRLGAHTDSVNRGGRIGLLYWIPLWRTISLCTRAQQALLKTSRRNSLSLSSIGGRKASL